MKYMDKKKYIKPTLRMEMFTISQSVANTCEITPASNGTMGKANHSSEGSCGWDLGNFSIWIGDNTNCTIPELSDADVNGVCYNNPSNGTNIFSSY